MADNAALICASAVLTEGEQGNRFSVNIGGKPHSAFLVRFETRVHAFLNCCPHLGTELDWQPGKFFDDSGLYLICATHGAVFIPDTGYCLGGPCKGQRLIRLPVVERDDGIFLTEGFQLYVE